MNRVAGLEAGSAALRAENEALRAEQARVLARLEALKRRPPER
ncbi:MAG TPA: hypothetical protein VHG91_06910 [Longimicrobium sp.]|nr:hypothetical protein [Longimicrobium sp.]